jgi:putative transposase
VIESLAGQGMNIRACTIMLGVSESGYYDWKDRPLSARALRRVWLGGLIADVHDASSGTYGALRVTAELRLAHATIVGHNAVASIMGELGLQGLPTRRKPKSLGVNLASAADLVKREFARSEPNRLWMTDITEHRTREGKVYCCVVLDAFSRKVIGWSIDSTQTATLVTNALGMAITARKLSNHAIIHSDRGAQFTSWAFSEKVRSAGLAPSMGAVGSPYDNAMMEAFWARMQVELLNRHRWRTRIELANKIFEYLELFHNKKRRHSSLNMLTPDAYETQYQQQRQAA